MASITVADNGPGIPDDKKNKVFEQFYSGDKAVADGHRSMGLGLALCRSIVDAHEGSISLTDDPSGGASFCFKLPIEEVTIHE